LADIAELFGNGEVRTTHMQNLLLPNIPDENLILACQALQASGFTWEGHSVRRGRDCLHGHRVLQPGDHRNQGAHDQHRHAPWSGA
jgi:dissimilatory sulfite reductase (desulfoviridin) alpha/beta subunit